jgi:hypothetical protein
MRPLSDVTAKIARQSFSQRHIALGRIISQWTEIMGHDLAARATPNSIRSLKTSRKGAPVVTLEIAATQADAVVLSYQKDLIIERINRIFGAGWVQSIRFVPAEHLTLPRSNKHKDRLRNEKSLTEAEKNTLYTWLEDIQDKDLKLRLEKLGQSILTEDTR